MSATLAGCTEPMGLSPEQVVLTEHIQNREKQLLHWGIAHALKNLFQFLTSRSVVHSAKRILKNSHLYKHRECQLSVIISNRSMHLNKWQLTQHTRTKLSQQNMFILSLQYREQSLAFLCVDGVIWITFGKLYKGK